MTNSPATSPSSAEAPLLTEDPNLMLPHEADTPLPLEADTPLLSPEADTPLPVRGKPDESYIVPKKRAPAPVVDLSFIHAMAPQPKGEDEVRQHHENLFLKARGAELRSYQQQVALRTANLRARDHELTRLRRELDRTPRYLDHPAPEGNTPWTVSDRIQAGALIAVMLIALWAGLYNGANILNKSGRAEFESWTACILMAIGVVLASTTVKALGTVLPKGLARTLYSIALLCAGGWFFGLWMLEYAGLLAKEGLTSLQSQLSALALDAPSTGSSSEHGENYAMLVCGLAGDALICGALWLLVTSMVDSHRLTVRQENQAYHIVRKEHDQAAAHRQQEASWLGILRGRLDALAAEKDGLIEQALALFENQRHQPRN